MGMSYASKRQALYNQVLERMSRVKLHSRSEIRIITDRMMAIEFENTFYSNHKFNLNQFSRSPFDLSLRLIFGNLFKGVMVTGHAISEVLMNFGSEKSKFPDCLVYGLPDHIIKGNTSSKDLRDFLALHLVKPGDSPPANILVQSRTLRQSQSNEGVHYVRDIGTALLKFSNERKLNLAALILKNFIKWLFSAIFRPEITFIGREYIIDSIVADQKLECQVKYIVSTQSMMLCLPSSFHRSPAASKIMFWYSDNSQQIRATHFDQQEKIDYTYLEEDSINLHFVWTESWATILRKHTRAEVKVIGPIIFKPIGFHPLVASKGSIPVKILVFDVTPKQALSGSTNFYTESNVMGFVSDILAALKLIQIDSNIDLKPKRPYTKFDSRKYIDFLDANSSHLNLLSPIQDIPKLIESYDLVICIPFTSPAIIAKHLGIRTLYYSPTADFELGQMYEDIRVIVGRDALLKELVGFLL